MKLNLEITKKGLRIRKEILNASGFHREAALDVHGMEQAIVVMRLGGLLAGGSVIYAG